jgi:hypothetical protein
MFHTHTLFFPKHTHMRPAQIRAIENTRHYNQNLLRGGMSEQRNDNVTKIVPVVRSAANAAATKEWCKMDDRYHAMAGYPVTQSPEERYAKMIPPYTYDPEAPPDITQSIFRPLTRNRWLEKENFWPVTMHRVALYTGRYRQYGDTDPYYAGPTNTRHSAAVYYNARLHSIGKYVEFKWEDNVEKFVVLGYTTLIYSQNYRNRNIDYGNNIILVSERRALGLFDVDDDGNLYRKSHQFDARAWGAGEYRIRQANDVYIPNFKRHYHHRDIIVTNYSIQRTLVRFIKRCSRKSRWRNPVGHR